MNKKTLSFDAFLNYFPEVELPITISEDLVHTADSFNKVLPASAVEDYILKWEDGEVDEYTEYIACFRLPETDEYHAIVYWKGGLMRYEYFLVTLNKQGELIAKKPVSTTISDGNTVKKSVAQIDEDLIIHIMAGENLADEKYDPNNSKAFNMEIMFTGDIIFSLGDD